VTADAADPGRLPLVPVESADEHLAKVFGVFRDSHREVPELYRALGNAPAMLEAWTALAWPLRLEATTSRGLRELLIMRVAQLTDSPFEWVAHWEMAVKYGIGEEQLVALSRWRDDDSLTVEQRAALAMADELTTDLDVTDATWSALAEHFDAGGLVELVLTVSFYSCVSRVLHAIRIDADVDDDDPRLKALRAGR
jgi:alkylhydroperoxidase family enzyme